MREYRVSEAEKDSTIIQAMNVGATRDGQPLVEIIYHDRKTIHETELTTTFGSHGYTDHIAGGLVPLVREARERGNKESVIFADRELITESPHYQI